MRRATLSTAIATVALLAAATNAKASIQISYSIDGGAAVTCGPDISNTVLCGNTVTPFQISFLGAASNSPGQPGIAEEESATVRIKNVTSSTHSIVIQVGSDGFTQPTTPPSVEFLSHIGGTVVTGGAANLLSFKSCAFLGASLTPCIGGVASPSGTPSITGVGSFDDDKTGSILSLTAPYSLGEQINLTLGAGSEINFAASTTLTQVPEPASVALLGAAVLLAATRLKSRVRR